MGSWQLKHLRMNLQCERAQRSEDDGLSFFASPRSSNKKTFESLGNYLVGSPQKPTKSTASLHSSPSPNKLSGLYSPTSQGKMSSPYSVASHDEITERKSLPWEQKSHLIKGLHSTNLGLKRREEDSETASQAMNFFIDKDFQRNRNKQFAELEKRLITCEPSFDEFQSYRSSDIPVQRESQGDWWKNQGENRHQIKKRQTKDHYKEFVSGTEPLKIPNHSRYSEEHEFNKLMEEVCQTMRPDNHLFKDEMKNYHEAFIKHRPTLRVFKNLDQRSRASEIAYFIRYCQICW